MLVIGILEIGWWYDAQCPCYRVPLEDEQSITVSLVGHDESGPVSFGYLSYQSQSFFREQLALVDKERASFYSLSWVLWVLVHSINYCPSPGPEIDILSLSPSKAPWFGKKTTQLRGTEYATQICATLAYGLFWAEGNEDRADSGKTVTFPLTA